MELVILRNIPLFREIVWVLYVDCNISLHQQISSGYDPRH